jgi:hypothetical protein
MNDTSKKRAASDDHLSGSAGRKLRCSEQAGPP